MLVNAGRRLDQIYRVDPVEAPGESNFFPALLLRHQKPCQPVHNGRRREAEQPVCGESGCVACAALAHAWPSRAGRHRTGTWTTLVEWSTRLTSATARSMAATTVPAVRRTVRRDSLGSFDCVACESRSAELVHSYMPFYIDLGCHTRAVCILDIHYC